MKVIGIVGPIGAGKDVVSSFLEQKYGFKTVNMGDIVREFTSKKGKKLTRENLHKIQKEYTDKYGQGFFAQETIKRVINNWSISGELTTENMTMEIRAIINGIRRMEDARIPKERFGNNMLLIAVSSEQKLRYERLKARGNERDPDNFESFMKQEDAEKRLFDIPKLMEFADVKVENNGNMEQLQKAIQTVLLEKNFIRLSV